MIPLIGTRKSELAIAYTDKAIKHLDVPTTKVYIDSEADLNPEVTIEELGNKGVFSKAAETALLEGHIDIACHAYKDLTRDSEHLLQVNCVLERADFRDCLIGNNINPRTIGTSSPRRAIQLKDLYPGAEIVPIRGNIDTRIKKQENGEYDAIVLAKAGLDALGITMKASRIFGTADMLPAAGQGVIALQSRKLGYPRDEQITALLWSKNHIDTWYTVMAETEMLKEINGDCHTPVGVLSYIDNGVLHMVAKHFDTDKLSINRGPVEEYKTIGAELGKALL